MKEKINWVSSIIKSGYSLKDKFILCFYFMVWPLRKAFLKNMKLISDVTIKNQEGIFYCSNDFSAVWGAHPSCESELRKYFGTVRGVFIDIGANIGKYSIMVGNKLKNKGNVIAIEPESKNFKILEKNIRLNNLNNVIVISKGCFSKKGKLTFYLDNIGTGGHSLVKKEVGNKKIEIEVDTLDNILKNLKIKRVDLIKIDVEGAEADVLKGAEKTLKKHHPKIIFEAWNEEYLKKCKKILDKFGYDIKQIAPENYIAI